MFEFLSLFNILSLILMIICTNILCNHKVKDKTSQCFIVCQILIINWILCHIMDFVVTNIISKFIFSSIGYISVCSISAMFFLFSLFYVNSKLTESKVFICILFIPSIILYLMFLTDPILHLFFESFSMNETVGSIGFYITAGYSYFLLVVGIGNMIYKNLKSFRNKKLQLLLISLSAIIPLIVNSLSIMNIVSAGYDFTPSSFSVSSILIFVAIYKFEFISTSPFAVEQLLSTMKEAVLITDKKGTITFINNSMKNWFDFSDDVMYKNIGYIIEKIKKTIIDDSKEQLKSFCMSKENSELTIECNNKRYYYITKMNIISRNRKEAELFVFTDITQYRKFTNELCIKNAELSAANDQLVKMNIVTKNLAVEKERVRIAQELHDSLGHNLVSVMTLLKLSLISDKDAESNVKQALALSENLLGDIRNCVSGIKETTELGVSSKIHSLIDNLGVVGECIELSIIGEEKPYHSFAGDTIYSVVREAVTNSLKNGDAEKINVIIKFRCDAIKGYIIDNGKGCEEILMSHGLCGMKEKVNSLGGKIRFVSSPDDGFSVNFILPVEESMV